MIFYSRQLIFKVKLLDCGGALQKRPRPAALNPFLHAVFQPRQIYYLNKTLAPYAEPPLPDTKIRCVFPLDYVINTANSGGSYRSCTLCEFKSGKN
jgi:hypothetical protein